MASEKKPTLRVRVTSVAEKMARGGHPWIFADSVREMNREGETGELAIIFDKRNQFLAVGLFDAESPIRVRILTRQRETIDEGWVLRRAIEAAQRRETMFDSATTGYRCVNGESDGLPGIVIDRYGAALVLKLYTTAWAGKARGLAEGLVKCMTGIETVVLRLSRNIQERTAERFGMSEGEALMGTPPDGTVIFLEHGLKFESDICRGQKTGFFLDQRENRLAVRKAAAGAAVLNLFSFSGGFSLAAAAGGARKAVSIDISEHALAAARRNFVLNNENTQVRDCRHETVRADVFEWLKGAIAEEFDIVVVDPPSLARRESERSAALEAYGRLIGGAVRRVREGGLLLACSCSAHVTKEEFFAAARGAVRESGREFEELQTTGHAADHAATFAEGEYLKAAYFRMR